MQKMNGYDGDWLTRVAKAACLELDASRLSELADAVGAELCDLSRLTGDGDLEWQNQGWAVSDFREDCVGAFLDAEDLLAAAPRRAEDYFAVPEVLSEGGASS